MIAPESRKPLLAAQKRYASMSLFGAVAIGGSLILLGFEPLGKGLILGTLFSIVNFTLMAIALPYRLGLSRRRTFWVSLTSIYCRFAIMAIPLIIGVKHPQVAVSAVAAGLFMVPLCIFGERMWMQWRHPEEVGI